MTVNGQTVEEVMLVGPGWPYIAFEEQSFSKHSYCSSCRRNLRFYDPRDRESNRKLDEGLWEILLICPNCGKTERPIVLEGDLRELDAVLDDAEQRILGEISALKRHIWRTQILGRGDREDRASSEDAHRYKGWGI